MGAITNDPFKLARYAGFYKALQSAGSAGSFGMDAVATPFLNEHVRHVPLFINLKVRRWYEPLIVGQLDHDAGVSAARGHCDTHDQGDELRGRESAFVPVFFR